MIKMQSSEEPFFTLECKICKKEYRENYERICFAFSMKFKCSEDVCIQCRVLKAARLECAIVELAEDLGLTICQGRRACTALMNKSKIKKEEVLPDYLQKKLDKIPLTYPRNLKKNTRPFSSNQGSGLQGDASETDFVMVNKDDKDTSEIDFEVVNKSDKDTSGSDIEVLEECGIQRFVIDDKIIEMYISGKLTGDIGST